MCSGYVEPWVANMSSYLFSIGITYLQMAYILVNICIYCAYWLICPGILPLFVYSLLLYAMPSLSFLCFTFCSLTFGFPVVIFSACRLPVLSSRVLQTSKTPASTKCVKTLINVTHPALGGREGGRRFLEAELENHRGISLNPPSPDSMDWAMPKSQSIGEMHQTTEWHGVGIGSLSWQIQFTQLCDWENKKTRKYL